MAILFYLILANSLFINQLRTESINEKLKNEYWRRYFANMVLNGERSRIMEKAQQLKKNSRGVIPWNDKVLQSILSTKDVSIRDEKNFIQIIIFIPNLQEGELEIFLKERIIYLRENKQLSSKKQKHGLSKMVYIPADVKEETMKVNYAEHILMIEIQKKNNLNN